MPELALVFRMQIGIGLSGDPDRFRVCPVSAEVSCHLNLTHRFAGGLKPFGSLFAKKLRLNRIDRRQLAG